MGSPDMRDETDSRSTVVGLAIAARHGIAISTPGAAVDSTAASSRPANLLSATALPLIDRFGRVHRSLRISVTDRCNIRCQYCMPEVAEFMQPERLLSFEEIASFVQVMATLGIRKLRITGGEPLMRPELPRLIRMLSAIAGIEDIALTTNGMLLAEQLDALASAGLQRVNISLDTLSDATFQRLSRRQGLDKVLKGIAAAVNHPGIRVRLNALVMRDINLQDVLPLVQFAKENKVALRFIEFMPLDAERAWNRTQMVSGQELRQLVEQKFGALVRLNDCDPAQPAIDYAFADGQGVIGFIDSVTQPFCGGCDRLRLTADGKLRNCLFSREEWNLRALLRTTEPERWIEAVRECLAAKRAAHGIDATDFTPPERAMFQIGG